MCCVADCAVREEVVLSPAELADFRRLFFCASLRVLREKSISLPLDIKRKQLCPKSVDSMISLSPCTSQTIIRLIFMCDIRSIGR